MYTTNNTVDMNPGNELKGSGLELNSSFSVGSGLHEVQVSQGKWLTIILPLNNNQGGVFKTILVK